MLTTQLVVALDPSSRIQSGSRSEIWVDLTRAHAFDPATGDNLTAAAAGQPAGAAAV